MYPQNVQRGFCTISLATAKLKNSVDVNLLLFGRALPEKLFIRSILSRAVIPPKKQFQVWSDRYSRVPPSCPLKYRTQSVTKPQPTSPNKLSQLNDLILPSTALSTVRRFSEQSSRKYSFNIHRSVSRYHPQSAQQFKSA